MNTQDFLNKITQIFNKEAKDTEAVESKSFDIYLFLDTVLEELPQGLIIDLYAALKHIARLCSDKFGYYTLMSEMIAVCAEIIYEKYTDVKGGELKIYESATFLELVGDEEPLNDSEDFIYNCLTAEEFGMFIVKGKEGLLEEIGDDEFSFFN